MFYRVFVCLILLSVLCLLPVLCLSCGAKKETAAPQQETVVWTDSCGRAVLVPKTITRIAPSGALAQLVLYSLCPDKIIGWSSAFSDTQKKYIAEKYWSLPAFGQFYGRNTNLNMEALLTAKPDIVIDIGEVKPNIKDDMDGLQTQLGIPVIFVEATLDTMSAAYLQLGEVLHEAEQATLLSRYVEETLADAALKRRSIENGKQARVYFGVGKTGQEANGRGSIHADVIEYVGAENVADLEKQTGAGMTPVSMEQIVLWNPDTVIFGIDDAYNAVQKDPPWQSLKAIQDDDYFVVPLEPYGWMGRPPSVNRLIGIKWLGNLLYPDVFDYDMVAEAKRFYALFYHYDLSDDEARALMAKSTFKKQR
jgi:iron complex transport system substrate-binding protein